MATTETYEADKLEEAIEPAVAEASASEAGDGAPDRDKLRLFFQQPLEVLDLKLRPHTADTDVLMELARFPLRKRLDDLTKTMGDGEDVIKWRDGMALYYGIAATLYIHSAPEKEVEQAAWNPESFHVNLSAFLSRYTRDELFSAVPVLNQLLDGALKARDWKSQGRGGLPPPNGSTPDGSRST